VTDDESGATTAARVALANSRIALEHFPYETRPFAWLPELCYVRERALLVGKLRQVFDLFKEIVHRAPTSSAEELGRNRWERARPAPGLTR
jgi:hypothetical protein